MRTAAAFGAACAILVVWGCRGPQGPAGPNAEGFDALPPTLKITQPWPLDSYWDSTTVTASAVDNVEVESVTFTVDGSVLAGTTPLVFTSAPFRFTLRTADVGTGWHFLAARARDTAGNFTDAPPIPVWMGFSADLQDTFLILAYHNRAPARTWTIPDEYRTTMLWSSFSTPRQGSADRIMIFLGGNMADTSGSTVAVGLWTGRGYPESPVHIDTLAATEVSGSVTLRRLDFSPLDLEGKVDFYVAVNFAYRAPGDTLYVGADDGSPFWNRSGSRDDEGWHPLAERFGVQSNLMVSVQLYFAPDTSHASRR